LDIGCGIGKQVALHANAIGLDINRQSINQAHRTFKNDFVCGDAETLPFKSNYFECVIAREVIEHLQYPRKALNEILRVLNKRGILVLTTPNRGVTKGIYKYKEHVYEFNLSEIRFLLENHGFEVIRNTGSSIPYIPWGMKKIYILNFNKFFFFIWKILDKAINAKWDVIVLAKKRVKKTT